MNRMKPVWMVIGSLILLVIITVATVGGSYNNLVTLNENIDGQWSQVENNLQRRADLIPNLVETVKGFATQEKEIFESVAEARSKLIGASGVRELGEANTELSSALGRLLAISESYPTLKSDANFRQLQDELAGTENRIARARQEYNNSVQMYNTKVKRFPANIIASMFGFSPREYFQADEKSKNVPEVKF